MKKREFLRVACAGATAGLGTVASAQNGPEAAVSPVLLTVSGLIGPGNRGPIDPALDQLMTKQKVSFSSARGFDFNALTALPSVTIRPTLEYDGKQHTLRGPLLTEVMRASGVKVSEKTAFLVRAIDGYAVQLTAKEAAERRFIIATHFDGKPMTLGGLGPLWTVYEPDKFADMATKPLSERFGLCPWATYHIDVRAV